MTGVTEEIGKATGSFLDIMRKEPLSLSLIVMNLALLGFFYILLTRVADQREREINLLYQDKKEVRELLAKCVVPNQRGDDDNGDRKVQLEPLIPLPPPRPPQHTEENP